MLHCLLEGGGTKGRTKRSLGDGRPSNTSAFLPYASKGGGGPLHDGISRVEVIPAVPDGEAWDSPTELLHPGNSVGGQQNVLQPSSKGAREWLGNRPVRAGEQQGAGQPQTCVGQGPERLVWTQDRGQRPLSPLCHTPHQSPTPLRAALTIMNHPKWRHSLQGQKDSLQ